MNTIEAKLKVLDMEWSGADAEYGFGTIPDGTYEATVDSVELKETKEKRFPMVVIKAHLTGPDRFVWKNHAIRGPESLSFLKTDLAILGCCPVRLSQLADDRTLRVCYGQTVRVTLKTKGDGHQRVYLSK